MSPSSAIWPGAFAGEKMLVSRLYASIVTGFVLLVMTSCTTTPPPPAYPEITFQHLLPLNLAVSEIKIVNEYRPPLKSPHVEHEFPVSIDGALRNWVRDRLRSAGGNAFATVTIRDASAVEVPLKKQKGLKGLVTKDQSERYDVRVLVDLKIEDISGSSGFVTSEARRSRTVAEDISLNNRHKVYFELTEEVMQDFDAEMEKNIRQFLKDFIR